MVAMPFLDTLPFQTCAIIIFYLAHPQYVQSALQPPTLIYRYQSSPMWEGLTFDAGEAEELSIWQYPGTSVPLSYILNLNVLQALLSGTVLTLPFRGTLPSVFFRLINERRGLFVAMAPVGAVNEAVRGERWVSS